MKHSLATLSVHLNSLGTCQVKFEGFTMLWPLVTFHKLHDACRTLQTPKQLPRTRNMLYPKMNVWMQVWTLNSPALFKARQLFGKTQSRGPQPRWLWPTTQASACLKVGHGRDGQVCVKLHFLAWRGQASGGSVSGRRPRARVAPFMGVAGTPAPSIQKNGASGWASGGCLHSCTECHLHEWSFVG